MLTKLSRILALFTPDRVELTAAEVAQALSMPRSTTYRLLSRIVESGFLDVDDATGRFRLGIRLAALGALAQRSTTLQQAAHAELHRLSVEVNETATLMVLSGTQGLTTDVAESLQPLMVSGLLGGHLPLHASAGGKVLLAWMPERERLAVVRGPLTPITARTITDPNRLMAELEQVRTRGYAVVQGEWADQINAAAAPVWNYANEMIGAITVGGPQSRVTEARLAELAARVAESAARVSVTMGWRRS